MAAAVGSAAAADQDHHAEQCGDERQSERQMAGQSLPGRLADPGLADRGFGRVNLRVGRLISASHTAPHLLELPPSLLPELRVEGVAHPPPGTKHDRHGDQAEESDEKADSC